MRKLINQHVKMINLRKYRDARVEVMKETIELKIPSTF